MANLAELARPTDTSPKPVDSLGLKGDRGGIWIADTDAHTGVFEAIQCIEEAVATLVSSNITGTLTSITLPAGSVIFGRFSSITLASGVVLAYNAT